MLDRNSSPSEHLGTTKSWSFYSFYSLQPGTNLVTPCGYHVDLSEKCLHFLLASPKKSPTCPSWVGTSPERHREWSWSRSLHPGHGMAMGPSHSPAITRNAAQRASMRHSTESWAYQRWEMMGKSQTKQPLGGCTKWRSRFVSTIWSVFFPSLTPSAVQKSEWWN